MVAPKTEEAIELLRINGELTSKTLAEVGKWVAPGVTTAKLNEVAETFIRDHGAVPNFLDYDGYPSAICASVNDVVVHGFPSDKVVLQEGDIVSIDLGTLYKGYNGDSAYTFPVGEVDAETRKLLEVTKAALYKGIEQAVAGNRVGSAISDTRCNRMPSHSVSGSYVSWKATVSAGTCTKDRASRTTGTRVAGRVSSKE